MTDAQVAVAALAVLTTITTGFFAQARRQDKTHQTIATGLLEVAKTIDQGNKEAEKRNGHLADLVVQSKKQTLSAIQTVKEQHVEHQEVHEADIKKAVIKEK